MSIALLPQHACSESGREDFVTTPRPATSSSANHSLQCSAIELFHAHPTTTNVGWGLYDSTADGD